MAVLSASRKYVLVRRVPVPFGAASAIRRAQKARWFVGDMTLVNGRERSTALVPYVVLHARFTQQIVRPGALPCVHNGFVGGHR